MEMTQAVLFIAGALMMGLGALGASVGIGILVAASWKALPSARTDPHAAYAVLHRDGSGRRRADDRCRSGHVRSVRRCRLIRGLTRTCSNPVIKKVRI